MRGTRRFRPSCNSFVGGIKGLATVRFDPGMETGLVQLRELLQKAGLRDLERQATYAIESNKTRNAFLDGDDFGSTLEAILPMVGVRFDDAIWHVSRARPQVHLLCLVGC